MIDSKTLPDSGPFQMVAHLEPDHDMSPDDYDGYTPKQVKAWMHDEWQFVGLVVTVSLDDKEIGSASLWAIEHGYIPLTDEDDNLTEEPVQHYNVLDDASTGSTLDDVANEALEDAMRFVAKVKVTA